MDHLVEWANKLQGPALGALFLICPLNLTLNEKPSSHKLQFASKYHVFLNSLQAQIWDHTHHNSGAAAIYYTAVGLEKSNREQTDREQRKQLQRLL